VLKLDDKIMDPWLTAGVGEVGFNERVSRRGGIGKLDMSGREGKAGSSV